MNNNNYSPVASARNAGGNNGPKKISDGESIFQIEVEKIKPNPFQSRHDFNDEELGDLAQSIREFGIIQSLIVSKVFKETEAGTDVEYQLIAGNAVCGHRSSPVWNACRPS